MSASAATSSGRVTLGSVMQKFFGKSPRDFAASSVRKISRVRMLRSRSSSVKGLMRMPMNGGRSPAFIPVPTSFAADAAWPSSSSSGRLPYPSSKSSRKSSIGSRCSFSRTRR